MFHYHYKAYSKRQPHSLPSNLDESNLCTTAVEDGNLWLKFIESEHINTNLINLIGHSFQAKLKSNTCSRTVVCLRPQIGYRHMRFWTSAQRCVSVCISSPRACLPRYVCVSEHTCGYSHRPSLHPWGTPGGHRALNICCRWALSANEPPWPWACELLTSKHPWQQPSFSGPNSPWCHYLAETGSWSGRVESERLVHSKGSVPSSTKTLGMARGQGKNVSLAPSLTLCNVLGLSNSCNQRGYLLEECSDASDHTLKTCIMSERLTPQDLSHGCFISCIRLYTVIENVHFCSHSGLRK